MVKIICYDWFKAIRNQSDNESNNEMSTEQKVLISFKREVPAKLINMKE